LDFAASFFVAMHDEQYKNSVLFYINSANSANPVWALLQPVTAAAG